VDVSLNAKEINMLRSGFRFSLATLCAMVLLFGIVNATSDSMSVKRLTDTIVKIRTGDTSVIRTEAAQHLFELTSGIDPNEVGDKTIVDLISLLDLSDDSVRYWVARCLGNFGLRARIAIPTLQKVLAEVDCLQGSKTSASGIRFALTQMGVTPPAPTCGSTK
jgi:hypothetical protein